MFFWGNLAARTKARGSRAKAVSDLQDLVAVTEGADLPRGTHTINELLSGSPGYFLVVKPHKSQVKCSWLPANLTERLGGFALESS